MRNLSVQALLDWLENQGLLLQRPQAEAFVLCQKNIEHAPIYIHILLGFGALLGCSFAIGLLKVSGIIDWNNDLSLIMYGGIFIGLAIILHYALRHTEELLHSFGLQLSCILMLIGKVLFMFGMTYKLHTLFPRIGESWLATLSIAMVVLPTYFLFPVGLDRFLSTLALLVALLANSLFQYHHNIVFFSYYIALLALTGILLNYKNKSYDFEAITYASICTLGFCSIYLCSSVDYLKPVINLKLMIPWVFFNLILSVAIIAQIVAIVRIPKPINHLTFWAACLGMLILGIASTNGILFGIGLLIIGYGKHRLTLIIAGAIFFALFIFDYYYSINLTLAQKSAVIAGSGAILLLVRMALQHEKWDKPS
ncbi:MAG: DUF4401 domain-containing protein [Candidatus Berkiella sp.]